MPIVADRHAYFLSLAAELNAQSQRIRHLIGDRHWLSDGHHKEYLFSALLLRHLPTSVSVSRGFVADLSDPSLCSKEQDILIADAAVHGPLFNQGGLRVVAPSTVVATISVKSTMTTSTVRETIENQNSVRQVVSKSGAGASKLMTFGFFYEVGPAILRDPTVVYNAIETGVAASPCACSLLEAQPRNSACPDMIVSGTDLVFDAREEFIKDSRHVRVRGFHCNGLATAVLLANVLEHVAVLYGGVSDALPELIEHPGIKPLSTPEFLFATK